MLRMNYAPEKIQAAKQMYLRHMKPQEIAAELNIGSVRTIYLWIEKNGWQNILEHETPVQALERRMVLLAAKDNKTQGDLAEITNLVDNIGKLRKLYAMPLGSTLADESSKKDKRAKKEKPIKNDVSALTAEDFEREFISKMFAYQRGWREAKLNPLTSWIRFILKSRQIGATYYFAAEAFEDAVLSGDNQIFISASRSQAEIFRAYIIGFAKSWFGIELTGNPIVLSNGAELHFLSTNSSTAQGYHGHTYFDEVFWTQNWQKLDKLAGAMSLQAKYRTTYFSTPSTKQHGAYPLWSGEKFNEGRSEKKKGDFAFSDAQLQAGIVGADGIWRQVVTVMDALAGGCDLFDIERLRLRYSKDEFNNLLMCKFIDGTHSVFTLHELVRCMSDASSWLDFNPASQRPFGNLPVWIGYDPSRTTDNAAVVVIAPPAKVGGVFRLLEKHRYTGKSIQFQAARLRELCEKYKVEHLAMDTTGIGLAVKDLVTDFFPRVTAIHYTVETKNGLVLKARDVIETGRLEFDASHSDIAPAFMCIRRATTPGGMVTFVADRTEKNGHADVAFAIMHALQHEPINTNRNTSSTWVVN